MPALNLEKRHVVGRISSNNGRRCVPLLRTHLDAMRLPEDVCGG